MFSLQRSLAKLLLFDRLDPSVQTKIIEHTWTRQVVAGEIPIQEGETGLAATELYVVKSGSFEVGYASSVLPGYRIGIAFLPVTILPQSLVLLCLMYRASLPPV